MAKVRVLVVEDSITVRKYLVEVLASDAGIDVVGEAENGKRGIELCQALRPDIVTVDMMMPLMSGLAATEYIMAHCPTPILIVSASTNRGELFKTFEALAAGAVDVVEKPTGEPLDDDSWRQHFVSTVKLVSRIKVITHLNGRLAARARSVQTPAPAPPGASRNGCQVVALGASTGGPAAVIDILRALPPRYPIPILLVVHIGEPFGSAFAEWLDGQTPFRVAYAREGAPVGAAHSQVIMAPPDRHLLVRDGRLRLTSDPERHSCRPSVDVLFESVAREFGSHSAACLLTGMGRDGAAGLLAIRRAGGLTVAQDEATSIVYGMPREAVLLDAAERVLPLDQIGPTLVRLAQSGAGSVHAS